MSPYQLPRASWLHSAKAIIYFPPTAAYSVRPGCACLAQGSNRQRTKTACQEPLDEKGLLLCVAWGIFSLACLNTNDNYSYLVTDDQVISANTPCFQFLSMVQWGGKEKDLVHFLSELLVEWGITHCLSSFWPKAACGHLGTNFTYPFANSFNMCHSAICIYFFLFGSKSVKFGLLPGKCA